MKNLFVLILSFVMLQSFAQVAEEGGSPSANLLEEAEGILQELGKTILTEKDQELRLEAADKFNEEFLSALELPDAFSYRFDSLTNVSILYPKDSTFRVMSWQLYVDMDEYKYFGVIQTKAKKKEQGQIFPLMDYSSRMRSPDHISLSKDNWYGALYYNLKEFKHEGKKKYLLFGFDAYKFFEKRKLIEVLSFDEDGDPVFGSPVIEYVKRRNNIPPQTLTYHRFILQYSSKTSINLNYNEYEEKVLFDHLVSMASGHPDIPYVMIPDGSYEGFILKKGIWTYEEKVFDHKYEQGDFPRPMPVLDARKGKSIIDK